MLRLRTTSSDPRSFQNLIREHIPAVRRYAYAFARDWSEADDLAQEALIRAYRSFDRFEGRAKLVTWLFSITRNVCHDYLRGRAANERRRTDALDESFPANVDDSADLLEAKRSSERLWHAVRRLDPEFRTALVLFEIEGLSYEQIAAVEGIPIGTVRSRLSRARQRLALLLSEALDAEDTTGTEADARTSIIHGVTG